MQRALQGEYGYDFITMTAVQRAAYIRDMVLALTNELHELLNTVPWKPWATYPAEADIQAKEYTGELVDCLHMLVNLALAGDVTSWDLSERFREKHQLNWDRLRHGYDGHWDTTDCRD